jgi:hypothetical protein
VRTKYEASMFFFEKKNQKTFASLKRSQQQRAPQEIKVFCFFFSKKKAFLPFLLAMGAASALHAQQVAKPAVGANQIFSALVQPDRPVEVGLLHGLRDTLARQPDPATLQSARAQVDTILQAEEKREGDMPPALVMSALASRMEAALAGLENARHVPPPPSPSPERPWLVPALAAAAGSLALALVACLVFLAARTQPAEDTGDIRDTLNKIKRRLDDAAGGMRQALSLADSARGDASDAVQEAGVAVVRLGAAAREAETKLRGSVDEAEQHLRAAAAIAGEFEQWLESLPSRLTEVFDRAEACGGGHLEAAAAQIAGGVAQLAEVAASLPASQLALQETIEALAQADTASARALDALKAASERAEEQLPALVAAGVNAAHEGLQEGSNQEALEAIRSLGAHLERMGAALPEAVAQAVEKGVAIALGEAAASLEAAARVPALVSAELHALHVRGVEAIDLAAARLADAALEIAGKAVAEPTAQQVLQLANLMGASPDAEAQAAPGMRNLADRLLEAATRMETALEAAELARERAVGDALAAKASQAESHEAVLEALSARADAAIGALPAEASALAASAAGLRAEATLLGETAERMEQAAAEAAGHQPDGIVPALEAVAVAVQRIEERLRRQDAGSDGLDEQASILRAEMQRAVSCLEAGEARLTMAARHAVAATDDAMAMVAKGCAETESAAVSSRRFVLDVQALLAEQTARVSAILDSSEDVAVRLQTLLAREQRLKAEGGAALQGEVGTEAAFHAWDEGHSALQAAISHVQTLVSRLVSGAEAQEAALERATNAAAAVAALIASPEGIQNSSETRHTIQPETGVTLFQLTEMAKEAERLRRATESLASCALQGQVSVQSPEIFSQTPALLAAIDTCIHQLRGAGTALALASDANQKAA